MSGFDDTPNPTGYTSGPASTQTNDTSAGNAGFNASDPRVDQTAGYGAPGSVPPGYAGAGYTGQGYTGPGYAGSTYTATGSAAPPVAAGLPNPGLATLLGFIPGVGAMYNGQFAKGIAHVVIFAVLVSLSDHVNGIFGLLVAGWVFYMVFDAYQTARARRDGLVVPDPFGLNNIGERFGIGHGPNWSDFTAKPAPGTTPPPYTAPAAGYAEYRDPVVPVANPAGAPYDQGSSGAYVGDTGYTHVASSSAAYSYAPPAPNAQAYPAQPYTTYANAQSAAYGSTFAPPIPPLPPAGGSASSLPTGAIWLIGFGFFALIGTLSHRFYWSNQYLDGAIVAAIGIVLLVTRTLRARGVYPAGSAASTWYLLRTSRPGLALLAIGIALTLDNAGVLTWKYLWPYLLILLGTFLLVERAAHNRMLGAGPMPPIGTEPSDPIFTSPVEPPSSSATSSFIPRDEEGRSL